MRCEDFPCCGHDLSGNPCDGVPSYTASEFDEAFYCGMCGFAHQGDCRSWDDEDDEW
jgi:hypothetical protein